MRMRKKKHGAERIAACDAYMIHEASEITDFPVEIEIGCGKGAFICGMAKKNPDTSYIAMEKISDVIMFAAEKIKAEELTNVKCILGDAKDITSYFPPNSVRRIYLNFSDPWPKSGYYKRRLTYKGFLELYKSVLVPNGEIIFKTDNVGLFDFSLEQFEEAGFKLRELTRDLHNSEYMADNIMTEYEKNFSEKGFPIHRVVAYL
ncbi:MAG: tRNA (guanosine(46)-N7)-methyltransferase TrmB [Clostridia bacterium]|nr:tRNA (guanosine(46)-N7)-methyltransferase TrmB [Clostridia bacterium]